MPGWAGSCWYYLRFCDPRNDGRFVSRQADQYWMDGDAASGGVGGVDLYIGGAEHAVLHLLYARFWHKLLYDLGEVSTPEPFRKLFHQGLITSFAYQRPNGSLVPTDQVEEVNEDEFIETATGEPVTQVVAKMSKSLKNVINPDDVIHDYGADTFRLYEMYMGPLEASKPWNTRDIIGVHRFLQRVWRLVVDEETGELVLADEADDGIERMLHRTIAKVGGDIERLAFNTAIAAMIELVNEANKAGGLTADQLARFATILSPFAPHIAEELWSKLGRDTPVSEADWPEHDESMLTDDEIELPVQIMGKVRGKVSVPADADQKTVEDIALADDRVREQIAGKTVRKVIVVPGKIVNIVAN
jgi:leucyl-tRNA synthetase